MSKQFLSTRDHKSCKSIHQSGRNIWKADQIKEFEEREGIQQSDVLPPLIESAFLKKRYNRSSVTLWRWVRSGYLPTPHKLGG